jgi:hypothetical protein
VDFGYVEQVVDERPNPLQAEAVADLTGEVFDADPDAGGTPLMDALSGAIESNLALEGDRDDHADQVAEQTRPLTAADMKSVLQRMAVSRQKTHRKGNRRGAPLHSKGAGAEDVPSSPISATSRHRIVSTEKWHVQGVERALTGDKYGEYKAKDYK